MSTSSTPHTAGSVASAGRFGSSSLGTHPGAKDFAASIKAREVLEPITVWVADEGDLMVYRGSAAPWRRLRSEPRTLRPGPCRPRPAEVDRVTDQLVENVRRADDARRGGTRRDRVAVLALGVSAAQITERTSITRPTVDAPLPSPPARAPGSE